MNTALIAGAASGAAGLLVFLVIHHFWIKPIWFILPPGLVVAGLGGLAVGWAYAEIRSGMPAHPWTVLALAAVVAATLAPAIVLAQLRPAPLDVATGTLAAGQTAAGVAARFILELLLTATLVGGAMGWLLGRTTRAGLATALAGFIFALGPGHNIPFLGSTPATGKGLVLLTAIVLVASVVLVVVDAWLAPQARS